MEKDGPLWAPVEVSETSSRKNVSVVSISAMVLDFDAGTTPDEALGSLRIKGLAFVAHSSHSHSFAQPKFRVVLPFSRPVPVSAWPAVWKHLHQEHGPQSDVACKNPARIYYLPSCPPEGLREAWSTWSAGALIDIDQVLAEIAQTPAVAPTRAPAARSSIPLGSGDYKTLDLVAWAQANGARPRPEEGGEGKIFIDCPWRDEHTDRFQGSKDTYLLDKGDGWPVVKCSHGHCQGRGFNELRMAWTNVDSFCSQQFQRRPMDTGSGPGVQDATDEEIEAEVNTTLWLGIWNPAQENGLPKCGVSNAAIFLRHQFQGQPVRYNEFTRLIEVAGKPVMDGEVAGLHERLERVTEQTKWSQAHIDKALLLLSREVPQHHPIREYLKALQWDEEDRIANLVHETFQIEEPLEIHQRYLECFFISAVARVMNPGCKVDTALILQGPQGARKSSFFHFLVPNEEWFSDDMGALDNKDASLAVAHSWIIEWAELESVRRSNVGSVKAFLTRQTDKYRPPYGRTIIDTPRSSVIVGTTNEEQFLQDSTGNRRYMVIPVRHIDTDAVKRDRDQLWAEAVYKFRLGQPWHLTHEEMAIQAMKNAELVSEDPWQETIRAWLPKTRLTTSLLTVTIDLIMTECLQIPVERRTHATHVRAGRALTTLGWTQRKVRAEGHRQRLYTAPENWPDNV